MPESAASTPPGSWKFRRRIIHWTLIYWAAFIPPATWLGHDKAAVIQVVMAGIGLCTTIILAYVAGAVIDDRNARSAAQ